MTLQIGSILPEECDYMAAGIYVQFFWTECTDFIIRKIQEGDEEHETGEKSRYIKAARRDHYFSVMAANHITICLDEQLKFGLPGRYLRMPLKRPDFCPWYGKAVQLQIDVDYEEATGPVNGVNAETKTYFETWPVDQELAFNHPFESNGLPDSPWIGRFSVAGQPMSVNLKLSGEELPDECGLGTITLEGDWLTYDGAATVTMSQINRISTRACENDFIDPATGESVRQFSMFWTGAWFEGELIGLVRTITITVKAIGYIG